MQLAYHPAHRLDLVWRIRLTVCLICSIDNQQQLSTISSATTSEILLTVVVLATIHGSASLETSFPASHVCLLRSFAIAIWLQIAPKCRFSVLSAACVALLLQHQQDLEAPTRPRSTNSLRMRSSELMILQVMRTAHDPDNDTDKAALKKHVVRAINNLAGKDAPKATAASDVVSCCQRSEGGASTFSRYAVQLDITHWLALHHAPSVSRQTCCIVQVRICSVVPGDLNMLPGDLNMLENNPAQTVNLVYGKFGSSAPRNECIFLWLKRCRRAVTRLSRRRQVDHMSLCHHAEPCLGVQL